MKLYTSICLVRISTGIAANTSYAWSYQTIAILFFVSAIIPTNLEEMLSKCIEKVTKAMKVVFTAVYNLFEYIFPMVRDAIVNFFHHPLLVGLYKGCILPCYKFVTPYILPVATAYVSSLCLSNCLSLYSTTSLTLTSLSSIFDKYTVLTALL